MNTTFVGTNRNVDGCYSVGINNLAKHVILNQDIIDEATKHGLIIERNGDDVLIMPIDVKWTEADAIKSSKVIAHCIIINGFQNMFKGRKV